MKKLISVIGALVIAAGSVHAATVSKTIAAGVFTNLLTASPSGSLKVTQFVLTATATNNAAFSAVDTYTNNLTYTNPAYVVYSSYQTNYITTYTNYYGVTNSFTNVAMVDYYVTNSAVTNAYPIRFTATAITNTTSIFDGVNYYFQNGLWVTNTGNGPLTLTITYQQ